MPRSEIEREVQEELQFHLEKRTERLVQQGLSPVQAKEEAERRFGTVDAVRRQCVGLSMGREKKRMRLERLTDLWRDLRYSIRALVRRPGFTATAVLTIAMGLGAVTSIFSLLDAVLLRALPYSDADRLTDIWGPFQSEAIFLGLSNANWTMRPTCSLLMPLTSVITRTMSTPALCRFSMAFNFTSNRLPTRRCELAALPMPSNWR